MFVDPEAKSTFGFGHSNTIISTYGLMVRHDCGVIVSSLSFRFSDALVRHGVECQLQLINCSWMCQLQLKITIKGVKHLRRMPTAVANHHEGNNIIAVSTSAAENRKVKLEIMRLILKQYDIRQLILKQYDIRHSTAVDSIAVFVLYLTHECFNEHLWVCMSAFMSL